jgi:hypothetical protein
LIWCLRFYDLLEPNRDWSQLAGFSGRRGKPAQIGLRRTLNEGVYLQARLLVDWFGEQGMPVHPNIRRPNRNFLRSKQNTAFDDPATVMDRTRLSRGFRLNSHGAGRSLTLANPTGFQIPRCAHTHPCLGGSVPCGIAGICKTYNRHMFKLNPQSNGSHTFITRPHGLNSHGVGRSLTVANSTRF